MKHLLVATAPALALLVACSLSERKLPDPDQLAPPQTRGYVSLPSKALSKQSGTSLKDLHIGFGVYLRKCGECHTHALPEDLSRKDWHVVTPRMAWNANITDQEQSALLKYLLAAKADPKQPEKQPEIRFQAITPNP